MEKEIFWQDEEIKKISENIANKGLKVVLPEGEDKRVIGALNYIENIKVVLLGDENIISEKIKEVYKEESQKIMDKVEIINPKLTKRNDLVEIFVEKRNGKIDEQTALQLSEENNYFATLLLEADEVNSLVGGCVYSTADILKPAFQIIKPKPGVSTVSSVFIMKKDDQRLLFADCAVNVEPNKLQLKEIVRQTIITANELSIKPKLAMLSYSSKGSATSEKIDIIKQAYEELILESPELKEIIDGELQFDAAYNSVVANQKVPKSTVAGNANVFIFPDLNAGNISYKIAQYLGGYEAVGPLLQGLNKPVNDLSRGADAPSIAKVIYLSLRQY